MTGRSGAGGRGADVIGGGTDGGTGVRTDIQGLRALAVALVVVYDLWPTALPGGYAGVDVFFVITGFLMTGMLLRHPPRRVRDLADFWARRIRRVLPAAFLVIAVTGIVTWAVAPSPLWITTAQQGLASTFGAQNWVLAATGVTHLAPDHAASPLQQFWTLSVGAQFALVWPLLVVAVLWWASRRRARHEAAAATTGRSARGTIGATPVVAAAGAIVVLSLAFSIWYTAVAPSPAYFVTPTRLWEMALGGLVAALPARLSRTLPPAARSGLSWLGVAAIVVTAVLVTDSTPFPGWAALLPAAGTAIVLWCHPVASWSPDRVLALRPVRYLGDISYSLYLWHWPIIALLPYVSGPLGSLDKAVALVGAIVLADLTRSAVEDPFRRTRTPRSLLNTYRFGGVSVLVLALAAGMWLSSTTAQVYGLQQPMTAAESNAGPCFGAASMAKGFTECPQDPAVSPVPSAGDAGDDRPVVYQDNCWSYRPFTARPVCSYGDGPIKVALVGNSHAGHWLPALMMLAKARGWTITTYLISRCVPSDTRQQFETPDVSTNCQDYGQWVLDHTAHGQYDLIITSNRESVQAVGQHTWTGSEKAAAAGFHTYLQSWAAGGTPIVLIHDLPYPGKTIDDIPDCLAEHGANVDRCAGTPQSWHWYYPYATAAQGVPGVHTIDMTRYFCTSSTCPAVIGGVTVYFDSSHMTATYSRTLTPYLAAQLDKLHLG